MINFLWVYCPLTYNYILGWLFLPTIVAISSTYHLANKFLTKIGINVILEEYKVVQECYNVGIYQGQKCDWGIHEYYLLFFLFFTFFTFKRVLGKFLHDNVNISTQKKRMNKIA